MSAQDRIFVQGCGVVSPAGWGIEPFRESLKRGEALSTREITRPGHKRIMRARSVPPVSPKPAFMAHARLRRSSPIAHYAVGAALEALGPDAGEVTAGKIRLGIIFCALSGCVNYSRRFYDEVLKDPMTASPLVFPETVYNSPASHFAALLGSTAINYTIVGDPGTFVQGLALAADWLLDGRVDGCVVIGAEELDWLTSDSTRLFSKNAIVSDGAGALYLRRQTDRNPSIELGGITSPQLFTRKRTRLQAVQLARAELPGTGRGQVLCDSGQGVPALDRDERSAWSDWIGDRISPRTILGDGFMAAAAWQCVAAVDALNRKQYPAANVSVIGTNQQAIAARFVVAEI